MTKLNLKAVIKIDGRWNDGIYELYEELQGQKFLRTSSRLEWIFLEQIQLKIQRGWVYQFERYFVSFELFEDFPVVINILGQNFWNCLFWASLKRLLTDGNFSLERVTEILILD